MTRPTLDDLKAVRDGQLSAGQFRKPVRRPVTLPSGHVIRPDPMGTGDIEWAPQGCGCAACADRRRR